MSLRTQLIAVLALAVVGGAWWLHHSGYAQGRADTQAKFERVQRDLAQAQQEERDREDAKYRGQILATQAAKKVLADKLADSGRMLQSLRKQLQAAGTCSGLNDAGEDWIGILAESWAGYTDMAAEAGRLADKVTGLQGYIKAIQNQKEN